MQLLGLNVFRLQLNCMQTTTVTSWQDTERRTYGQTKRRENHDQLKWKFIIEGY